MTHKLDADVKEMTPAELRREVMRWRSAARQEVCHVGNGRCWTRLVANLPEHEAQKPLALPREEFLRNCARYYDRNRKRPNDRETKKLLAEGRRLAGRVEKEMRPLFDLRKTAHVRFR